jgi:hypothetical protein
MKFTHFATLPVKLICQLAYFDWQNTAIIRANTLQIFANNKNLTIEFASVPTACVFLSIDKIAVGLENGMVEVWALVDQPLCLARLRVNDHVEKSPITAMVAIKPYNQKDSDKPRIITGHRSGEVKSWLIGQTTEKETFLACRGMQKISNHPVVDIAPNSTHRLIAIASNLEFSDQPTSHLISLVDPLFNKTQLASVEPTQGKLLAVKWSTRHPSELAILTRFQTSHRTANELFIVDTNHNTVLNKGFEANNDLRFTANRKPNFNFFYSRDINERFIYTITDNQVLVAWDSVSGQLMGSAVIPGVNILALSETVIHKEHYLYALAQNGDIFISRIDYAIKFN